MKPIEFTEANITLAKSQPQYSPLPAYVGEDGHTITCWKLTWRERLDVLRRGVIWHHLVTFGQRPQAQAIETKNPFKP